MDEAAAKLRIEIDSLPVELDELQRKIMQLEIEREAIRRENDKDKETSSRRDRRTVGKRDDLQGQVAERESRLIEGIQKEKENIEHYKLEAEQAERSGDYGKVAELRYGKIQEAEAEARRTEKQVQEMQGDAMLKEEVDSRRYCRSSGQMDRYPGKKMLQSDREKLLHLEEELGKRVAGQEEAIGAFPMPCAEAVPAAGPETPDRLFHLPRHHRCG
jgi:ATP-dependent Clp protease ATP-binding subunit ClpB